MDEIALMREIARLQGQIDALRTIEIGGVWQDWTPTVTPGTGTITSYTASGQYSSVGKIAFITLTINIINNGTGATYILVSNLPFTPSGTFFVTGYENAVTGETLVGRVTPSIIVIVDYKNAYPAGTGHVLNLSGFYRIA